MLTEPGLDDGIQLDHEKLIVYGVARELVVYVEDLLTRKMPAELHKQLMTSTMSIMSNIGEGAGKTALADKRRFYEYARGSTSEAATQLDLLQIKRIIQPAEYRHARRLVIRVVQMLSRLCSGPRMTGP